MTTCGTGNWTGPLPGDPDNNSVLHTTSLFGGVRVSWTYPTINPHAVAGIYLYRSSTNDFALATRLAVTSGDNYFDPHPDIMVDTAFYYWIKIISINGTIAETIGPIVGTARPKIENILTELTGRINSGLLAPALSGSIADAITVANQSILDVAALTAINTFLSNTIDGVQGSVDVAELAIQEEVIQRVTQTSALAVELANLESAMGDNYAAITDENYVFTNGDKSLAGKVSELTVSVGAIDVAAVVGLTAEVNDLTGTVEGIYEAKVSVTDAAGEVLIGGFGLVNDGTAVEAGFDVDTFWVGRSVVDPITGLVTKVRPFIIDGDQVYINQAVIKELTIDKLRTALGGVVIEDGLLGSANLGLNWGAVAGTGRPTDNANNTATALNAGTTITGGGITLSSGGAIASYGKTWSNTTEGFYLGYTGVAGKYGLDIVGAGQFKVRSATSGARVEMTEAVIKVYDAAGTLRVKLGDLSA